MTPVRFDALIISDLAGGGSAIFEIALRHDRLGEVIPLWLGFKKALTQARVPHRARDPRA
jgi:hypothetical protein